MCLKGGDTLLEAFEKGLSKSYQLHIVTQSGYFDEETKWKIHNTPNVFTYIDFKLGSDELHTLYQNADVLIHPTNLDTSSWVALEAMASGVLVIINPIAGISDIVLDGMTGLHIPPKNPEAIIEAVHKLFGDDNFRQNIITNARRHVEQNFDVVRNTGILMGWIKELIDERRG